MSPITEAGGQTQERPVARDGQPADDQPMPGLGWFFRTPFYKDWLFWVGVGFAIWSQVGRASYFMLMGIMLIYYWPLGAVVSRRRRQGRPPVQRLRIRGWGFDAYCAVFTAFVLGFGAFLVIEALVSYVRLHELF